MPDAATARDGAGFIVEGRADADTPRADIGFTGKRRVRLTDVNVHRGSAGASVEFDNGGDCPPFKFVVGTRYLVYMQDPPAAQGAGVSVCARIVPSAAAQSEIAALVAQPAEPAAAPSSGSDAPAAAEEPDEPAVPAPAARTAPTPSKDGGCASCSVGDHSASSAPWSLAALGLLALSWLRRVVRRSRK